MASSSIVIAATDICLKLQKCGHKAFWVGGCVRDLFLFPKLVPHDIDICTSATPDEIAKIFGSAEFVGKNFGVCLVKTKDHAFEVATFRKEGPYSDRRHPDFVVAGTLKEDSGRRDFTINALYFDCIRGQLVDYYSGIEDLNRKTLRCVGDARARLYEDPLRILRLFRFASKLNFTVNTDTLESARALQQGILCLSKERIQMEFAKVPTRAAANFYGLLLKNLDLRLFLDVNNQLKINFDRVHSPRLIFTRFLELFPTVNNDFPFFCFLVYLSEVGLDPILQAKNILNFGYNLSSKEKKVLQKFAWLTCLDTSFDKQQTIFWNLDRALHLQNELLLFDYGHKFVSVVGDLMCDWPEFPFNEWKICDEVKNLNNEILMPACPTRQQLIALHTEFKLPTKFLGKLLRVGELAPYAHKALKAHDIELSDKLTINHACWKEEFIFWAKFLEKSATQPKTINR